MILDGPTGTWGPLNERGNAHLSANEEHLRRHRQRMFQTGLFICLMMLMLDAHSTHPIPPNARKDDTVPEEDPVEKKPLLQLKRVLEKQQGDGRLYPTNATGVYQGAWQIRDDRYAPIESMHETFLSTPNWTVMEKPIKLMARTGKFLMQLNMEPLTGIEELSLVWGNFKVSGNPSHPNIYSSFTQGVFFHKFGRVTMVTNEKQMFLKGNRALDSMDSEDNSTAIQSKVEYLKTHPSGNKSISKRHVKPATKPAGDISPGRRLAVRLERQLLHEGSRGGDGEETQDTVKDENHREMINVLQKSHGPLSAALVSSSGSQEDLVVQLNGDTNSEGPDKLPEESFTFPVPLGQTQVPEIASQPASTKHCHFFLDLKAGPSCEETGCKKDRKVPWVMSLEGRILSEDCKVDLNVTTTAFRLDLEKAYPKAVSYSLMTTLMCLLEMGFLFRQLHFSQSQAAAARVSLICIGQQCILDAIICVAHLLICAIIPQLFTAFASIAFFKLIIFCIVEMKYIVHISHSRDPQRFFNGGVNLMRQEFAMLHARFYALLILTVPTVWFLSDYVNYLVLIAYSYWIPQIVNNVIKEVRQPFHPLYLYGISCTRLIIPLYLYAWPGNLLHVILGSKNAKVDIGMALALIFWTGVQVGILYLQQRIGPRFMIPAQFLPAKYNYMRPLPPALAQTSQDTVENGSSLECVICYSTIDQATRDYMITPCDHIFHPTCLERWMEQKMECPVCRHVLPVT